MQRYFFLLLSLCVLCLIISAAGKDDKKSKDKKKEQTAKDVKKTTAGAAKPKGTPKKKAKIAKLKKGKKSKRPNKKKKGKKPSLKPVLKKTDRVFCKRWIKTVGFDRTCLHRRFHVYCPTKRPVCRALAKRRKRKESKKDKKTKKTKKTLAERRAERKAYFVAKKSDQYESCCKAQDVSRTCLGLCTFDKLNLRKNLCKTSKCVKDMQKLAYCANNGRNNTDCCEKRGVNAKVCQPFCDGSRGTKSVFENPGGIFYFAPCLTKLDQIQKCHMSRHVGKQKWKAQKWPVLKNVPAFPPLYAVGSFCQA